VSNDAWAKKNRRPKGCVAFRFWLRCSSVTAPLRGCSLVAPRQNRKSTQQTWSYLWNGVLSGTGVPPVRIAQPTHGRDARATTVWTPGSGDPTL